VTNSTPGIGTVKLLSGTKCSYRLTVVVTDIVTNSTTGIGTVKLLSGTKCSYRLTVAVTDSDKQHNWNWLCSIAQWYRR